MASSSSSHPRNEEHDAFSEIEPHGKRRKVDESSRLFDVFINHRGPDAKQTVALQLYNSLTELGIHVFLDSGEKEFGHSFPSTIEKAIHSASAHIAIFSEGYAESPWCLAELVLMLQSRAKIIPLFYGVKPSDLRYIEKGEYAKAFTKYKEKKRYMEKLKEWKEALQSVSFLTGHEISSNFNISDCQNIVSAVQKEVHRKKSLHVAKYPVGLHGLVKDFERQYLTNQGGKERAQIVGIFGMGGVGKTTLAKEMFNRNFSRYSQGCFLFDVREADEKTDFPSIQLRLLEDLFRQDKPNFRCTEEGTSHIGECIMRSKQLSFLIVLDDIDHVQQLNALLIMDMLNKSANSLVIVTTRDEAVLKNAGITVVYNLKEMDRNNAKELFCWHAFRQSNPSSGYEELVDLLIDVCGGLPLSLQILGSHVHGEDHKFWELELEKVKKTLPQDINKRLRISTDTLDNEEKQIFMDVACFFIGKLKKDAIRVWEASGWSAQHALRRLKNKCLVEEIKESKDAIRRTSRPQSLKDIGRVQKLKVYKLSYPLEDRFEDSKEGICVLTMHDHLRDLGQAMADELSHPRRLWRLQHLHSLRFKGFENILTQSKMRCSDSFLDQSTRLHVEYFVGESDNFAETSTALLWLALDLTGQTLTNIPPWIPLQNLEYLRIGSGSLERLWQNNEQAPFALKELQISDIDNVEELSFGLLQCLEELMIHSCKHLKSVTRTSDLTKLVKLNIHRCEKLEELSLVGLNSLEKIRIDKCDHLKNVTASDLTKLISLNIVRCEELEELSLIRLSCLKFHSISNLPMLKSIEVKGCKNLVSVYGKSWKLVKVNIYDCPKLELIPAIELLHLFQRMELLYYNNEVIRDRIIEMEKLPSDFLKVIGRALDGAESTLNANLFCDFMTASSVVEIGTEKTCDYLGKYLLSAIVLCAVVVVNTCTAAKTINDFLRECDIKPWLKFEVREGQWIITSVTSNRDEIQSYIDSKGNCFPFDYLCSSDDVTVERVTMPVMKGEERKVLRFLRIIVDKLYHK